MSSTRGLTRRTASTRGLPLRTASAQGDFFRDTSKSFDDHRKVVAIVCELTTYTPVARRRTRFTLIDEDTAFISEPYTISTLLFDFAFVAPSHLQSRSIHEVGDGAAEAESDGDCARLIICFHLHSLSSRLYFRKGKLAAGSAFMPIQMRESALYRSPNVQPSFPICGKASASSIAANTGIQNHHNSQGLS